MLRKKAYHCRLYLKIFNTQNYTVFKNSASGLFLKYSLNFANFSLHILKKRVSHMTYDALISLCTGLSQVD